VIQEQILESHPSAAEAQLFCRLMYRLKPVPFTGQVRTLYAKRGWINPSPRLLLLDSAGIRPVRLQGLNVRSLPSFGALHYVELHGLTFLQTLETT